MTRKATETYPRRIEHLGTEATYVAFTDDRTYDSDGGYATALRLEVVGDNLEEVDGWVTGELQKANMGLTRQPYRLFKLVPVNIQTHVTVTLDEQA